MFDGLRYARRVSALQAARDKTLKYYSDLIKARREASLGGKIDLDELNGIYQDQHWETDEIDDDIAELQTKRLLKQADQYLIPRPSYDPERGDWYQSKASGRFWLTPQAIVELRKAVRAEQRDRWDVWSRWVPVLFGLFGVVTGLVSAFKGTGVAAALEGILLALKVAIERHL